MIDTQDRSQFFDDSSPCIMKMNTSSSNDKLPILEEGWQCEKDNNVSILKRFEKRSSGSRFVEIVKVILYLELIFFIGWIGCVYLSDHIRNGSYNDLKPETSHACGNSAIGCTPVDINNQIDHEGTVREVRAKRNVEEDELKRETCRGNMNVTHDKIGQLTKQFIIGDDSNANILMLRETCRQEIVSLTIRVLMDKLIRTTYSSDPTELEWLSFALNIKEKIINSTGEEHRQQVEASGPPTPEMVADLRTASESMIRNYKECEKIIPIGDTSTTPSIGDLLNEREKCEAIGVRLLEIAHPLIVQIIPGDSSDPAIVQLRKQVENITTTVAVALSFDTRHVWSLDLITERVANLTNEEWREYISTIRNDVMNSTDSEQRQQLESNAPVTQEMINAIRAGVNKHIDNVRNCDELNVFINDVRKHVEKDHMRLKRDSNPISERGVYLLDHIGNVNYNGIKPETSYAYGNSAIGFTPPDINNQIDHKRSVSEVRAKRSIEEDELKRETCRINKNATRDKIIQLTNQFIIGDDSDANILMLREKCQDEIANLAFRVMMDKLISRKYSSDPTEEQWRTFALNIKQGIINSAGEEHRPQVEASGPPTPEIVTDLRTTIESTIRNYKDCEKIIPIDDASTTPSMGDLLKEREKCENIHVTLIEIARPLIVQIIPGDSADPSIVQLRERAENKTTAMAFTLSFVTRNVWDLDSIKERVANQTNEEWREYISTIRDDIMNSTDSEQRQKLESNAPVTQEMIKDIHTGFNTHIDNVRRCEELAVIINNLRKEEDHTRLKRYSNPISEHGLLGDYLENDVLNMVNLFSLGNIERLG